VVETAVAPETIQARRREVLREASVALQGRVVTLWEVSRGAAVVPVLHSTAKPDPDDTRLDLDSTLHRWGTSLIEGSQWVGCRLANGGQWCVAPVRRQPAAPPPSGVERRRAERMTLELAGLCVGLVDQPPIASRRLPESDALMELARQPSVIAHEVANPLTAALVGLESAVELVRNTEPLDAGFRLSVLEELASVGEGMEQAIRFLRSIQDRARGGLARSERFDPAQVVRSCVALERPLARKRGVVLHGVVAVTDVFLHGDPNGLYQILTNLIRNAVAASRDGGTPVAVSLEQVGEVLRLTVQDYGVGIAAEHLERIFEPGFTTQQFGSGSGTGLTVVRQTAEQMFGGSVDVQSVTGQGATFSVRFPIPPQRGFRGRSGTDVAPTTKGKR
jgi:two-component system NtrC family sensor kinase